MTVRRSLLFIPGNKPGMLQKGIVCGADSVIFDLEDAVAPAEKDTARLLVAQALKELFFCLSETIVRVNPLDAMGRADIPVVVACRPDAILLPKVQCADDIKEAVALIAAAEGPEQKPVQIVALIETPRGLAEAVAIATADPRVAALSLGAEDYMASLGAVRTKAGTEILTARSLLVNAAALAGIDAIDTPFTDLHDEAGLVQDIALARQLGFKGKFAINPRQINAINAAFTPSRQETGWAERVVRAFEEAQEQGAGVISVDGKMVDAPVVAQARQILDAARSVRLRGEI